MMFRADAYAAESSRTAILKCQVCFQDQTLTDNPSGTPEMYIMECCFSIVCKECVAVQSHTSTTNEVSNNESGLESAKKPAKICLSCLEPVVQGSESGGKLALTLAKYSVLSNLLASINESDKQAESQRRNSSSIYSFITGANSAQKFNNMCHRCQVKDHRFTCVTCSGGGSSQPTRLCIDCNTLIHSLGATFKAHKVHESVARTFHSDEEGRTSDERVLIAKLVLLEECPKHQEPIQYYFEEEVAESKSQFELAGVSYGCVRCTKTQENGTSYTKIDKDNLLNVYQLKQELFKERQSSLSTLNSMLSSFDLDVVEKLPQLKKLETQQMRDVFTRIMKTLSNKQLEIEQQIEEKYSKLNDHVHKEKQRMLTKKQVIERNYNLLERALEVIPLQILSCEEGLLEAMLMANQGLMKIVKAQESKIAQRRTLYSLDAETQTTEKQEPPFHLIEPDQMKGRLKTMESFASRIDAIVSELFKQISNQIEHSYQFSTSQPRPYTAQSSYTAQSAQGLTRKIETQPQPKASQLGSLSSDQFQKRNSSPQIRPGAITLEPASLQSYQTTNNLGLNFKNTELDLPGDSDTNTGITTENNAMLNQKSDEPKRQSIPTTKSGVLSAFVTQQNQAKQRMHRDSLTKSHLTIGNQASTNELELDKSPALQRSGKVIGGISRREQSYGAKGSNEHGAREASQSAAAYLVQNQSSTAGQRYTNSVVTGKLSKGTGGKWDISTKVLNSSRREPSVTSQNNTSQPQTQGQTRNPSLMNQNHSKNPSGDRSINRTVGNQRGGAHSTVGQTERWAANAMKRNSTNNLNISQDISSSELANLKNTPGDNSPKMSRVKTQTNEIAANKDQRQSNAFDPEKQIIKENIDKIDQNCLASRIFTHIAQTSTAIQVAWSHPSNFQKVVTTEDENGQQIQRKQHIQYVLEYGIGVKVDNKEQFRQIYKGKAHKCIITDLMPRTTFRLRVAPILNIEKGVLIGDKETSMHSQQDVEGNRKTAGLQQQGEWSEVTNITTKETQTFDVGGILSTHSPKAPNIMCAQLIAKGRKKWLAFDKAGTLMAAYGYSFGEHLWCLKIQYEEKQNPQLGTGQAQSALDQSGSMIVGVVNKRFSNQKMFGSVINYSIFKGEIVVKIFLDSNKKRLIIYSPQHPQGDIFSDLPKDGLFFPAVQNKTSIAKYKSSLKVFFKFDQPIPKDKAEIGNQLIYSSDDGLADNMTNEDLSQSASLVGSVSQSTSQSMIQGARPEEGKKESQSRRGPLKAGAQSIDKTSGAVRHTSSSRLNNLAGGAAGHRNPANMKESQITQNNAEADQ